MAKSEKKDQPAFNWCSRNSRLNKWIQIWSHQPMKINEAFTYLGRCDATSGRIWVDAQEHFSRATLCKAVIPWSWVIWIIWALTWVYSIYFLCSLDLQSHHDPAWLPLASSCALKVFGSRRFCPLQVAMFGIIVAKTHPGNATCVACLDEKTLKLTRPTPIQGSSPFWTDTQVASFQVGCRVHFQPTGHSFEGKSVGIESFIFWERLSEAVRGYPTFSQESGDT